ncbi:MAG: class I SAM-dependent methyltransferase [Nanoarchaeota archaeon]|nr:class I SAM-dependent methyltransferase [Nanoarchaeota archaeon]
MKENLAVEDIRKMSYTDFISLIKEENRPPGGKNTIKEFLLNSFANKDSKVLEVGCTNGFTSLEIARLLNCRVWGIDINKNSIINAKSRIRKEKVKFLYGNAYNIPFKDNYFDLVICSNATSFMSDKTRAILEYKRVVKPWGFIAISPMYYNKKPPEDIIKRVSDIIDSKIDIKSKIDWLNLLHQNKLEVYCIKDYSFNFKKKIEIERYVNQSLNKNHLKELPEEIFKAITKRWLNIVTIFNENLKYVGYSVILLRKRIEPEEVELFTNIPEPN